MYNISINIRDFEDILLDLGRHEGASTKSGHHIIMVRIAGICYRYEEIKISRTEFNSLCICNALDKLLYKAVMGNHLERTWTKTSWATYIPAQMSCTNLLYDRVKKTLLPLRHVDKCAAI